MDKGSFFIRQNSRYERITFAEILYLESCGNYVKIVTPKKSFYVLAPLKKVESLLPDDSFCRIHRSYIISISSLCAFNHSHVFLGDKTLPISDAFRQSLEEKLLLVSRDTEENMGNKPQDPIAGPILKYRLGGLEQRNQSS